MIKINIKIIFILELMPDEKKNVSFYQKLGFNIVKEGTPMQLCNPETMKVKL